MNAISSGDLRTATDPERYGSSSMLWRPVEFWAGVAIVAMWVAVLFTAVFGGDIASIGTTSTTKVPSAVAVALFASLASATVARSAFGRR